MDGICTDQVVRQVAFQGNHVPDLPLRKTRHKGEGEEKRGNSDLTTYTKVSKIATDI